MDNANSPEYLEKIKNQLFENLRMTAFAPSVQMTNVPRTPLFPNDNDNDPEGKGDPEDLDEREARLDDEDDDANPDTRMTERTWDKRIERDDEMMSSDDEDDTNIRSRNGVKPQPGSQRKRPGIMDHHNPNAPKENSVTNSPAMRTSITGVEDVSEMQLDGLDSSSATATRSALVADANARLGEELVHAKAAASGPIPHSARSAVSNVSTAGATVAGVENNRNRDGRASAIVTPPKSPNV